VFIGAAIFFLVTIKTKVQKNWAKNSYLKQAKGLKMSLLSVKISDITPIFA